MIPTDLPVLVLLWCAFALFCGGMIKGALGIGTPLLTVPMLAVVLPVQSAITLMAIPIVAANLWQSVKAPRLRQVIIDFLPAALALVAATMVGSKVLLLISEQVLLLLVGGIVIGLTILQASSYKFSIERKHLALTGVLFGSLSGLIGGISSMFGPMLILYLVSLKALGKEAFVGAISFLYLCAVIPWAVSLNVTGLLSGEMLWASCIATLPVACGLLLGEFLRRRFSDKQFQRAVLLVLLISGTSMIWQGLRH